MTTCIYEGWDGGGERGQEGGEGRGGEESATCACGGGKSMYLPLQSV